MGTVGMEMPNWFDNDFGGMMEKMTAAQALAEIAKCPRIEQAVSNKLAERDASIKQAAAENRVWAGPTRSQTIRNALAEVLQAAS